MKLIPFVGALLLFAVPVKAEENAGAQDRLAGYSYGYVYGVGYTYCDLVAQKQITKEFAKSEFEKLFNAIMKDPNSRVSKYHVELAYKSIIEDEDCKEAYQ